MGTKEKIINEALTLFSTNGYNAVSVRHIAAAVGIKASSLYNHFDGKHNILKEIIKINTKYIDDFLNTMKIDNLVNSEKYSDVESVNNIFIDISMRIIKFFVENDNVVKFRKLLTIEQFSNPKLGELYNKLFISNILEYEAKLFNRLMDENILLKKDPYILALQFYSPIFLLLYNEDKFSEKDYTYVKNHIFQFKDAYSMKG